VNKLPATIGKQKAITNQVIAQLKRIGAGVLELRLSILIIAFAIASLIVFSWHSYPKITYNGGLQGRYQLIALAAPDSTYFAGDLLPVNDMDVRQRLDRELTKQVIYGSGTAMHLKRFKFYFRKVKPILKQFGVPTDFMYVGAVESGFQPLVSPKGAAGFWQIVDVSGRNFGLEINNEVDERFHLELSTIAACRLFIAMKREFGTWTHALAAYNMGNGALSRSMASQGTNNFFDLRLNSETAKYLYKVVALKEVMERPTQYGIALNKGVNYGEEPVKYITIKQSIPSLETWAQTQKVPLRVIRAFNPWLRGSRLTVKAGKTYKIALPLKVRNYNIIQPTADLLAIELDSVETNDSLKINKDERPRVLEEDVPVASAVAKEKTDAEPKTISESSEVVPVQRTKAIKHTVQQGDNLSVLAKRYDVPVAEILKANKKMKRKAILKLNQEIVIPPQTKH